MSRIYKKTLKILSPFINSFVLIVFVILTSCSILPTEPEVAPVKAPPDKRELLFTQATRYFEAGNHEAALPIFLNISREPNSGEDRIYDESLLGLAQIYEKNDQPEKAILALNELIQRDTSKVPKTKLKFMLMKNHYRITNYYQAKKIKASLDEGYKSSAFTLNEIYHALYYGTSLYYDRHIFDELVFLGDIQKYFVFIMESDLQPESEKLTDLLILYYGRFVAHLDKDTITEELKKKLTISLLDQLSKFDKYKMTGQSKNLTQLNRFAQYSEEQQKNLTERLTGGRY